VAVALGLALGREALGVEALGVGPELRVAVGDPGEQHDVRARRDVVVADPVAGVRAPAHAGRRRVEPHRLLEHHRRVRQPLDVLSGRRAIAEHRVDLLVEALLCLGVVAEQVQRERQGDRRRVVAREHEDQDLVADLGVVERVAVVARVDQQAQQIVPAGRLRAPLGDQLVADAVDVALGAVRAPVRSRGPLARRRSGAQSALARVVAEERERGAHNGDRPLDVGAEQQPPDHAQRDARHLLVRVDRPADPRLPAGEKLSRLLCHRVRVARDPLAREQRLDEAPLAQPALVLAVEQPVAERPADLLVEAIVLAVAVGLGGKHAAHRVRMEQRVQRAAQPRRAGDEAHDVAVLAPRGLERAQHVALQIEGRADHRRALRRRGSTHVRADVRSADLIPHPPGVRISRRAVSASASTARRYCSSLIEMRQRHGFEGLGSWSGPSELTSPTAKMACQTAA
jgi:hypothetical protein